jgi:hypothetical protein
MAFFSYLIPYYAAQIVKFETTVTKLDNAADLKLILQQASNLKKFLEDIREEGYEKTYVTFCNEINAVKRLERLLADGLRRLGSKTEAELFYLCSEKYRLELPITTERFKSYELDSYLTKLQNLSRSDLVKTIVTNPKYAKLLERLEIILNEMVGYIQWLLQPGRATNYLFLLRDTLLPYLGIREIYRRGSNFEAIPILISRQFMGAFGNEQRLFNLIADPIYNSLEFNDQVDLAGFWANYQYQLQSYTDSEYLTLAAATKRYLQPKLSSKVYTAVESGVQGSIPLFLMTISTKINGWKMYTTVPWLFQIYQPHIFNPNYNYLRDMETFISHDRLFGFADFKNDQVFIKEYQNEELQTLAYYEIVRLKEKVNEAFQLG